MIEEYGFGRIRINGREFTSDLLLRNREILPEWWRKQGHGCTLEDILPALAHDPAVFVLGTGSSGLLKPDPGLEDALAARGIELVIMPTAKAVARYNRLLSSGVSCAAGLHLTC